MDFSARRRRRQLSPAMFIGIGITALIILIGGGIIVLSPYLLSHAAPAANGAVAVTTNGTAVQFTNVSQATINGQTATLQLQGMALTITDGANVPAATTTTATNVTTPTVTVNGTAVQFTNGV